MSLIEFEHLACESIYQIGINLSSVANIHNSKLCQIIACLFDAKYLPESVLAYCQLEYLD